ncbi:MAG TPA: tRNA (cytidine(34)-2'-O)-methyltransferase [Gemmatales bacterium]|nr:tRNA (cytidine(34)-2'-O)-methyltransferase [Gemmatales bacterium]
MKPTVPILHIALVEPDIAPNVGAIARLCAATNAKLHLIGKLGFRLQDKAIRRAGLDYWPYVDLEIHPTWEVFRSSWPQLRCWGFSARANASYLHASFQVGDCLVFGSETSGLPKTLIEQELANTLLKIPMPGENVRCLNLSMSAGIACYEALRQLNEL